MPKDRHVEVMFESIDKRLEEIEKDKCWKTDSDFEELKDTVDSVYNSVKEDREKIHTFREETFNLLGKINVMVKKIETNTKYYDEQYDMEAIENDFRDLRGNIEETRRNTAKIRNHLEKSSDPVVKPIYLEKGLNRLAKLITEWRKEKKFQTDANNIPEKLALIHSEVSEALEAHRNSKTSNVMPDEFVEELADIIIRVLDLCGALDIDISKAVYEKMCKNTNRPVKHGKNY